MNKKVIELTRFGKIHAAQRLKEIRKYLVEKNKHNSHN